MRRSRARSRRSSTRSSGDGPLALRNQALVELVYSAGLRSAEAVGLDLGDVDFEQELVHVRLGKGGKDRVVPLGEQAASLVARYVHEARPQLARGAETRSSSRRGDAGSTLRRCADSSLIHIGCDTHSRRTCSRAAPICERSRSCSATHLSPPPRCTATSTRSDCEGSTTTPTRDPELAGFLALLAAQRSPRTVDAYRRDLTALAAYLGKPVGRATLESWSAMSRSCGRTAFRTRHRASHRFGTQLLSPPAASRRTR